jgi:hypothetical protein
LSKNDFFLPEILHQGTTANHGEEGIDVIGQVDVEHHVVLHVVELLEALAVLGLVKVDDHLPQLRVELQEELERVGREYLQDIGKII